MKKQCFGLCGAMAVALVALAGSAHAATACQVSYTVTSQWNDGFVAAVQITNKGDALNGWKVSWDMPSGQAIANLWNGQPTQSQAHVEVLDASWNARIATGGVIDFGFTASHSGTNDTPTNISVNGVRCDGQDSGDPQPAMVACTADYKIVSQWNDGATVAVTVRNAGSALSGWTVAWDMPNGQRILGAWNAQASQSQAHVEMKNVDWNRNIATGADIQFGFNASHSGVNGIPAKLSVNGVTCDGKPGTPGPTPTAPIAPAALTAFVVDNGAVNLSWLDNSGDEQGFRVERRMVGASAWTLLGDTAAGAQSYSDAMVAMGSSYEYRVSAFNATGSSAAATTTATLLSLKQYGEQRYGQACAGCHGADGKGRKPLPSYTAAHLATLTGTIATTMPPANPSLCQGNCAQAIAAYLLDLLAPVPDGGGGGTQTCTGSAPPSPRSLRLLTRQEYQNSVNDLLGLSVSLVNSLPPENRVDGFDNNIGSNLMTGIRLEAFVSQAQALAAQALQTSYGRIVPCGTQDTACARQFIQTFGKKAYRRPLTTTEQDGYLALFSQNAFRTAVELSVARMLASPHFLYRSELGTLQTDGTYRLTPYETASGLSYLFLGSLPDDELFAAADQNQLQTSAQQTAQANRLLALPRARQQIGNFVGQWLLSSSPYTLPNKDMSVYPRFTDEVKKSMSEEMINFFNHVAFDSTRKFSELFLSTYAVVNKTLSDFYGLPGATGSSFTPVPVTNGTRTGVLTLGSILARYANSNESHPFKRGGFLYNRLLCDDLPFPQNAGIVKAPQQDPSATTRERFNFHSNSGATCMSCHQYIDPAGFAFENYDGAGQYRATENGRPVDASGTILGIETFSPTEQVTVSHLGDLSYLLANSPNAAQCVARQYYRYTTGKREGAEDSCAIDTYIQGYVASGHNLQTMLLGIVASPGFTLRRSN